MKIKKDWIEFEWTPDDTVVAGVILFIALIVSIFTSFVFGSKLPSSYYFGVFSYGSNGGSNMQCINAYIPWGNDYAVYCSNNKEDVLDFYKKANESLKGRK